MSKNAHRHLPVLVFASLFAIALMGVAAAARSDAATPPPQPMVVVLADGQDPAAVATTFSQRYGVQVGRVFRVALDGFSGQIPAAAIETIRNLPEVAMVTPDRLVQGTAQSLPSGINRIEGDASTALSGNGSGSYAGAPAVAVLDSGSGPHADINRAGGVNCQTGTTFDDGNGHGTHVAGIIGARDDTNGVVGVAPGVPIYSVRVLDNSLGARLSNLLCGIDWVTANAAAKNIKVANLSLSTPGTDDGNCGYTNNDALHRAICASVAAGVTYVSSAGNSGVSIANTTPAAYDEVLAVTAAVDYNGLPGGGAKATCQKGADDSAISWSNYALSSGPDTAHVVAAPGVCINSAWKGGGYKIQSGTSMASPHVAGTAALCIATGACAGLGPAGVVSKLRSDAAARTATYGFISDPWRPVSGRFYGNLIYAGGY